MDDVYLTCGNCSCEFLATFGQVRNRKHGGTVSSYCSAICRNTATSKRSKLPSRHGGICGTCGLPFASRYAGKKFCSIKCYAGSADLLAMLRANSGKATAARVLQLTGELPRPKIETTCMHCGVKSIDKASRKRQFCSKLCYRLYMVARFDRWIASPEAVNVPQGFDEFLTQTELPCLIEGCGWVGENLGTHVNYAHGITARDFKRAVGFNLHTGLVTPQLSAHLAGRAHLHDCVQTAKTLEARLNNLERGNLAAAFTRHYFSVEGHEHRTKARLLMYGSLEMQPVVCVGCGVDFLPAAGGWCAKFCTVACRDKRTKERKQLEICTLMCGQCGTEFGGRRDKQLRSARGKPVFCSRSCAQKRNASLRHPANPASVSPPREVL